MHISNSEENYLKEIYSLSGQGWKKIPNLQIGQRLGINPPTVTEMLRKLSEKGWIHYSRTEGASLTEEGEMLALQVIRKHRIWETFLVKTLGFNWDEVHEVAEQLEHIRSEKLLDELDRFLGYPEFDPHGEPIPNALGILPMQKSWPLMECREGEKVRLVSVGNRRNDLLQEMRKAGINLRSDLEISRIEDETASICLKTGKGNEFRISRTDAAYVQVIPES